MRRVYSLTLIVSFNIICLNSIFASQFIDKANKATVFIATYDSLGQTYYASGALAKDYKSDTCVFLITNKHVLEGKIKMRIETQISMLQKTNESQGKAEIKFIDDIPIVDKKGNALWKTDTTSYLDMAAIEIKFPLFPFKMEIEEREITMKIEQILLDTSDFTYDWEFQEGAKIYFIGYPLGIHGKRLPNPMIRQGIIASKNGKDFEDLFPKDSIQDVYIIDAWALEGSSGSSVFLSGIQEYGVDFSSTIKFIGITSERLITYDSLDTDAIIILSDSTKLKHNLSDTLKSKCNLPDTIPCRLKTLIPENTGLYFVIPAKKIRKVLAQFDKRWGN